VSRQPAVNFAKQPGLSPKVSALPANQQLALTQAALSSGDSIITSTVIAVLAHTPAFLPWFIGG
jgi:hypothetical protein